jgi:hypothetical protein
MTTVSEYPNLDKYVEAAQSAEGHAIGDFLGWLAIHDDFAVARWDEYQERYVALGEHSFEALMAEYFEIDIDAVHEEREAVYRSLTKG